MLSYTLYAITNDLGRFCRTRRYTNLDNSRARPTVLAVGAFFGCLDAFSLAYHIFYLSPSLSVLDID